MNTPDLRRSLVQILSIAAISFAQAPGGDANAILARADEYRNFKGRGLRFDLELVNESSGVAK